jgi:hypothetical protein
MIQPNFIFFVRCGNFFQKLRKLHERDYSVENAKTNQIQKFKKKKNTVYQKMEERSVSDLKKLFESFPKSGNSNAVRSFKITPKVEDTKTKISNASISQPISQTSNLPKDNSEITPSFFRDLPLQLIAQILINHTNELAQLVSLRRVSKGWKRLIDQPNLWREIGRRFFPLIPTNVGDLKLNILSYYTDFSYKWEFLQGLSSNVS